MMNEHYVKRKDFLKLAVMGAVLSMAVPVWVGGVSAEHPVSPNIIFIYLDDLGYGDISSYNPKSKINTPNIDRLAKQGMSFTDAHTPAAICGPSRYGLMTGRYPWRKGGGGTENGDKFEDTCIEKGRITLASLLKKRGYSAAQFGKWGLRHNYSEALNPGKKPGYKDSYDFPNKRLLGPELFGFDYSWCMTHLFPKPGTKDIGHSKHLFENGLPVDPKLGISDPYRWLPDSANKVVEYLEVYAGNKQNDAFGVKTNKPFFIYWDPPSPHEPIVPNKEFIGKSGAGAYGDFVVEIDDYIGKILNALDRLQLADKTLVVLSSDNGPERTCYKRIQSYTHYSMGDLRGAKRDMWEGGHRVPLIVRWPGIVKPDQRCDELVCMTDFFATFAEITKQELPDNAGEDSVSMMPLLLQGKGSMRKNVIHHTTTGRYAIRLGDWLFIDDKTGDCNVEPDWFRKERGVTPHKFRAELFNLKKDPQQTSNLYDKHPEKVKEMKTLLDQLKKADRSR